MRLFKKLPKEKRGSRPRGASAGIPEPAAHAAAPDGALVAAITAAIAAAIGASPNGITIRSLRRSATPEWGRQGRLEQLRF